MIDARKYREDIATLAGFVSVLATAVAARFPDDEELAGLNRLAHMFATVKCAQATRGASNGDMP